jgi:cytochrome c oxidase subunit 3
MGAVMLMHGFQGGYSLYYGGISAVCFCMYVWWRDIVREATFEGHHTLTVQLGLRNGTIMFIVSEIMFFFALFWAFFHSSIAPTIDIGAVWPPKGIAILNPWEIPFLNTILLLSSGASVTWAHHAILAGRRIESIYSLVVTIILAVIFTSLQILEYVEAPFNISDSVYGSCFFYGNRFSWSSRFYRYCFFNYLSNTADESSLYKKASFRFRGSCLVLAFC